MDNLEKNERIFQFTKEPQASPEGDSHTDPASAWSLQAMLGPKRFGTHPSNITDALEVVIIANSRELGMSSRARRAFQRIERMEMIKDHLRGGRE
jgi:hypothetical protein